MFGAADLERGLDIFNHTTIPFHPIHKLVLEACLWSVGFPTELRQYLVGSVGKCHWCSPARTLALEGICVQANETKQNKREDELRLVR